MDSKTLRPIERFSVMITVISGWHKTDLVQTLRIVLVENRARSRRLAGSLPAPVLAPTLAVESLPVTIRDRSWDALGVVRVDARAVVGAIARCWAGVVGSATLAPLV